MGQNFYVMYKGREKKVAIPLERLIAVSLSKFRCMENPYKNLVSGVHVLLTKDKLRIFGQNFPGFFWKITIGIGLVFNLKTP